MMQVHIVYGECGEYDDKKEWHVCAYLDEEKAKKRVEDAQAEAEKIFRLFDRVGNIPAGANKFDPKMLVDRWGGPQAEYDWFSVDLVE